MCGSFFAERDEVVRLFLQLLQVALAAAVLDDELEAAGRAEAGHRRRAEDCSPVASGISLGDASWRSRRR